MKEANWSPCRSEPEEVVPPKRHERRLLENIPPPTKWASMVPAVL